MFARELTNGALPNNKLNVAHIARRESENDFHGLTVPQIKLMEMFYRLECAVSNAHSQDVKEGNWNYIPYSHLRFYKALKAVVAEKGKDIRFLEMGCGLGTKLLIAAEWCGITSVDGIEINPTYAAIARDMLNHHGTVHNVNVKDFNDYGKYDVIYTYGEVKGMWRDRAVAAQVKEQMKPGAVSLEAVLNKEVRKWEKPCTS